MKHSQRNSSSRKFLHLALSTLALTGTIMAQEQSEEMASQSTPKAEGTAAQDISEASIYELMNYKITSPSRTEQRLFSTAAAVHVITDEDIRRSGARTIAEALRMSPGLSVAQIDSRNWAISSRGFNDFFANKLLVLMDGRSVYTPLFSGVFWDVQDTALMDIERIEVIRGPGAALWGANAVNGVINIITKHSKDTQGGYIEAGGGTEERAFTTLRYGGKISENAWYRAYAKYINRDENSRVGGGKGIDDWDMWRAGFRSDWAANEFNDLTFQGDVYTTDYGQELTVFTPPTFVRTLAGDGTAEGGNFLTAWTHRFSSESDFRLQLYYDRTERFDRVHREIRNTYDVDFQQRFAMLPRQEILIGGGYRLTEDDLSDGRDNTGAIRFAPESQGDQLFSAFVQDQIEVIEDKVEFTLGSKFEHNDYTGVEVQPNARLAYTPNEKNTFWAAVSRAVRTPSRFEHTIETWFIPPPSVLVGNPDYRSEELTAYEIGYRVQPHERISFDLATFYNDYDRLRSIVPSGRLRQGQLPNGALFNIPLFHTTNDMEAKTYGGEIAGNWNVTKEWKLTASYTLLQMDREAVSAVEGESPQNQFQLRSYLDLPHNVQLDTALFYVDNLNVRQVPSYFKLDTRVGWQPIENLDLSIVLQNLLDSKHPEFGNGFLTTAHEIERSVYGKLTYKF